jgi:hypothetical protein
MPAPPSVCNSNCGIYASADGTDSPHAVAFGTAAGERSQLYFANFAGLTFLAGGTPKPSLMKIDVGVQGRHLP